jgi:hypothetical protein
MAGVVKLTVNNADNELAVFINGITVYDKKTEGDPPLTEVVDLTPSLVAGNNTVVVIGINWGGPANFKGFFTVGTFQIPFGAKLASSPNGICFSQVFNIPY